MLRPSTASLAAATVAVLLVNLTGLLAKLGGATMFGAELALILLGGALALRSGQAALRDVGAGGVPLRVATVLLIAIALGQIGRDKRAFPLMPYAMYGRAAEGDASFYEYRGRHRSGAEKRFRPSTVIATLGRARIVKGLARKLDGIAARAAAGGDPAGELAVLRATVGALAALYNREHPRDPLTNVDVLRVDLPPPYTPGVATRTRVMTLDVEPTP